MDKSPFQKLSAELRNAIWELVLEPGKPLILNHRRAAAPPALTATCQQIRAETIEAFYNDRVVQLHLPSMNDPAPQWFQCIPVAYHRLELIKAFELRLAIDYIGDPFRFREEEPVFYEALHKLLPHLAKLLLACGYRDDRQPVFHYTQISLVPAEHKTIEWWRTRMEGHGFAFTFVDERPPTIDLETGMRRINLW
ncbi:hypothetical protein LTR17_009452 [Elasticomyces elasticus]|nr:hypothetical protein LTR17_009452 [Elasticomyces elasticus]